MKTIEKKKTFSLHDFVSLPGKTFDETADEFLKGFIAQMDEEMIKPYGILSSTSIGAKMTIKDHYSDSYRDTISFVGNAYLGMNTHPSTIEAAKRAIDKYGTGACASPIIGGSLDIHRKLEQSLAEFVSCEDALIYATGYAANCGTLLALLNKADIALVDMYVHASIFDGLYTTNTKLLKHNDLEYLEKTLIEVKDKYTTKLVIVDGVYSQGGDLSPLPDILKICKKYGAFLFVDDAHGIGVMGNNGRGTIEYYDLLGQINVVTGTFSKSFGAVGGFVAGSHKLIQYLKFYSRASTFSAAPVPSVTASVLEAIEVIKREPERRMILWQNTMYLKNKLLELGFDIGNSDSPIVPVMIYDEMKAKQVARLLLDRGIYTMPIIYPGVKRNNARLRITVLATHTIRDLDRLINALIEVFNIMNIRLRD
jgi:glycine C-acetyltransferase